jgi:2-octaprenyl-6-methoxyphenol hydroxylase
MADSYETRDVIISGAGLIGQTLALALAQHGISSHIIDPANPAQHLTAEFDGRASAISSSSGKFLAGIGVADALAGQGCPIRQIWVSDGLKPGEIDFVPAEDDDALGTMYENRLIRQALWDRLCAEPLVTRHMQSAVAASDRSDAAVTMTLSTGARIQGAILLVAEGRKSPTRDAAGLSVATWSYRHSAIVGAIAHSIPHDNIAYEIFYPAGPFALLPLPDWQDDQGSSPRSAFVWTVDERDAPALLKLGPRGFAAAMQKQMRGILGDIRLIASRASWPLGFHHAARITDTRLALVGDAAHGIHPIAGQGLNLGFRDVAALTEVLVDGTRLGMDLGDAQLLARYARWRSLDTSMVAMATDTLTRIYGVPGETASAVRRFGMGLIQKTKPVKDRLMAEARGESGALPKLLAGEVL